MALSTIDKSTLYQNQVLYTGTGSTASITGVGFQPDLSWIKVRDNTDNHVLFDAVRGATERIESNTTAAEVTAADELTAFDSDGFSIGGADRVNRNTDTYVGWNWIGNGSGSANTVGDIASTVSVNTTSGFSIVKYAGNATSGQTIGHGLGVVPKMIIIKRLTGGVTQWVVYHVGTGNTKALYLNTTAATTTTSGFFNDTTPAATLFTVGNDTATNGSGNDMIAYCFAEISGYSKLGIYTGNGSSTGDGAFIYTGFKPTFVMVKRTNGAKNWHIFDTTRSTSNITKADLKPNDTAVEDTSNDWLDILSNGFKWRIASGDADYADVNGDGDTYIYAAFGQPIISNSGVCANAR
jgi:hypothetical protein